MENRNRTIIIISLSTLAIILICGAAFAAYQIFFDRAEPTESPAAAYTQAAQTIVAQMTQAAGSTAVAQLTQIAGGAQPNQTVAPSLTAPPTQVPPTFVIPPTATFWAPPTATFWYPPTATSTIYVPPVVTQPPSVPCNRATFIRDVTIPDGTVLPPNTNFTKIWRVRNDGSCTWTVGYSLVFSTGTPMTANTVQPMPVTVPPGGQVDLAVDMRSPGTPATYQGNWLLRSSNGSIFGVGSSGNQALFVRIRVTAPPKPNPNYAYDFSANYCSAQWRTGAGNISCTMPTNDSRGSVAFLTAPDLENRTENEPGLWTRPNQSGDGFISGQYPAYQVKPGDRFVAELSCKSTSPSCDVTFRLDYLLSNGASGNLGAWREVNDRKTRIVDVSLDSIVGQNVQFILRMQNNANVSQANGIWFLPSIRNSPPTQQPLPPTVTPTATSQPPTPTFPPDENPPTATIPSYP
jgi:hypothetical protein